MLLTLVFVCVSTGSTTAAEHLMLVAPTDLQPLVKELIIAYERDSDVSFLVHFFSDAPE